MNEQIMDQRIIARAAATDAANRHMKSHGRDHWNEADYNYAVSEYNRLLPGEMKFDIPAIQKIRG